MPCYLLITLIVSFTCCATFLALSISLFTIVTCPILKIDGVTPHIYGKKTTKPFRKMGHVTIVNSNIDTARAVAQKVKEIIRVISK